MKDWNAYAERWQRNKDGIDIEAAEQPSDKESYLRFLGDEWGDKASVDEFVRDFVVWPGIGSATVLEIGAGGGRVAARIAPLCRELVCCDFPGELLELCAAALSGFGNVRYEHLSQDATGIPAGNESVDLVYAFDTLVHLDLRTVFRYFREAHRCLTGGGRAAFHLATLDSPAGFAHFVRSVDKGERAGRLASFEYVSDSAARAMAEAAGFAVLATSLGRSGNFYYERDAIYLLQKR